MNDDKVDAELEALEAEIDKEEEEKNPKPPKPVKKDIKSEPDLYPNIIENKYHNIDKMNSVEVLEKEKSLCYKIINYKKKIEKDYYEWEIKKKNCDKKIKSITDLIEKGTWNLSLYKSKIKEQYEYEMILLQNAETEPYLAENQKQTLKNRITERKNILEGEINNANEQEAENKKDPEKELEELEAFMADNPSTTNNNINTDTNTNNNTSSTDLYPSTVEEIYHNVGKYTCLGVLEKEKDISDIIIEYKTKKNYNYDNINKKKEDIDNKINSITSLVENGTWDLNMYKSKIKEQRDWEEKLLSLAENDNSLDNTQKKIVKARIDNRIKLIDKELSQNPELDEE